MFIKPRKHALRLAIGKRKWHNHYLLEQFK